MEKEIRFGPSGNSPSFYEAGYKTSVEAPKWLKSVGLNAYEYSFGRGYTMSFETASMIGAEGKKNGVMVSVHAPYYINFANPLPEMIEKSISYVLTGFKLLNCMQGEHLVVHVGTCGKLSRNDAIELIHKNMDDCLQRVYDAGYSNKFICAETMGKHAYIGDEYEIIDLCTKDKMLIPTFDFGHINSFSGGKLKAYEDYQRVIDYSIEKLGFEKTSNCHVHFSKIEYGPKGEIRHLNYDDEIYGPDFEPFAKLLVDYKLTPTIICESRDFMAEDVLIMKEIYNKALLRS